MRVGFGSWLVVANRTIQANRFVTSTQICRRCRRETGNQ
jgi:hypothetical protein